MVETAAILNPYKKILIPDIRAECPMAHMLSAEDVRNARRKHTDAAVVLYINSLAEAKAEADILCTSANAIQAVESLSQDKILFGPDMNLAQYVSQKVDKEIISIPEQGYCHVHKMFHFGDLCFLRERYPDAEVIVHSECNLDVQKFADEVLSTGGMVRHVAQSFKRTFIITTELDMITCLQREYPAKKFIPALKDAICVNMKLITTEKVRNCLLNEGFVVRVDEKIANKAKIAIKRMIKVSKNH